MNAADMEVTTPRDVPWCYQPPFFVFANLTIYALLRLWWGGSNYLPGKVWYALCFIIPCFVAFSTVTGALCIPIRLDLPTLLHLAAALLYMQIDLLVARWLCGAEYFGSANAFGLFLSKIFTVTPQIGDGGVPPLLRSVFEFNGALLHEIFWNLCICQGFINQGWPDAAAIFIIPVISCAMHAVTSNFMEGLRCAPQFCWVALAYHASGSVLPSGFIHAMWYMTDGKLLVNLATVKRDWDYVSRTEAGEFMTPPPDKPFFFGWLCILVYYGALNVLVECFPALRSVDPHVARCSYGAFPENVAERIILGGFCFQILLGVAGWNTVRAAMDTLAENGDATTNGFIRCDAAVAAHLGKPAPFEEDPDLPAFSNRNPDMSSQDSNSSASTHELRKHCCGE